MTRATIAADALPAGGYNLTDQSDATTMSTGAGNGVSFPFNRNDTVVLINGSGMTATVTIKVPSPTEYSSRVTIPDESVSIADGKTYLYKLTPIFKQSDGNVYIDCDQAIDILVLRDPTS